MIGKNMVLYGDGESNEPSRTINIAARENLNNLIVISTSPETDGPVEAMEK